MNKNEKVIGGYKCGCSYGPVKIKDRLEYCAVHGEDIQNEYAVLTLENKETDTEKTE